MERRRHCAATRHRRHRHTRHPARRPSTLLTITARRDQRQRLARTRHNSAPIAAYERVVDPGVPVATDAGLLYARLEYAIASLRPALIFVGILALLALGVGIYALVKDDGMTGTRRGAASDARVTRVNDRVDRLGRQVHSLRGSNRSSSAAGGGSSALPQRLATVEKTVADLRSQPATAAPDATKAIQDLSKRIDDLDQRVQDLQTQSQTTTP